MLNLGAGGIESAFPKFRAWVWWGGAGGGQVPELRCSVSRKQEGRYGGQAKQTKSNAAKQALHTQMSTLHFKVSFKSIFTKFGTLRWCPAKHIPRFSTFCSVIIYAFAIILQKLFSLFPSCTLYNKSQGIKKLTSWLFSYMLWTANISWQENNETGCPHQKGEKPCVACVWNKRPTVRLSNNRLSPALVNHGQWQMKPSQAVPCTLVVLWAEHSHSWESLRHCAQLILSAHAKTAYKGSHCNGAVGTCTLGTGLRPPTHWLNALFHSLPPNGNQFLALSIHEQLDNTILNVHMLVRERNGYTKSRLHFQTSERGSHIIDRNWFSKIMAGADCLLIACWALWWCVCFSSCINKRSCKEKDGNQGSLKFPWKHFILALPCWVFLFFFLAKWSHFQCWRLFSWTVSDSFLLLL